MFSKTGLYIVAAELLHISVKEAEEFYGPLRRLFVERRKPGLGERIRAILSEDLDIDIPPGKYMEMAELLKEENAEREFNKIIEYMTGVDRSKARGEAAKEKLGESKCLALLYEGVGAIAKIRARLGSTDPRRAEPGTVRSDYGIDLMMNGAHASDSIESAERERKVLGMWKNPGRGEFKQRLVAYLGGVG